MFDEEYIKAIIRNVPDYPKKGIMFRDITTLLKDKKRFHMCIEKD
jgi:adenine phosphoribosyltransferase